MAVKSAFMSRLMSQRRDSLAWDGFDLTIDQ
jgi:hypothetical protein